MAQRGQVDVPPRLAAGALDLEPRIAAVERLVDRRLWIDRAAVGPHPLVPAFAEKLIGLADQRLAFGPCFGGLLGEDGRHRPSPAELLRQCLAVASAERRRVTLGRHPAGSVERRPAAVLFVASRPLRAGVVEQAPAHIPPDGLWTVEPGGIGLLDLDGSAAAPTASASVAGT